MRFLNTNNSKLIVKKKKKKTTDCFLQFLLALLSPFSIIECEAPECGEGAVNGRGCCHTTVRLNLYTGLHYNLVQNDHFGIQPEKAKLAYKNSR